MTQQKISNESLSEVLVDWRTSYKYEIDGIIVINDKFIHERIKIQHMLSHLRWFYQTKL